MVALADVGHPPVWQADLGCLSFLWKEFSGIFLRPRPNFTASHVPRPGAHVWDEHGSYIAVPNNGIGDILGLSGAGCEFGACGAGPGSFQAGAIALPAAGGAAICAAAEPCGAIAIGVAGTIGAIYLGNMAIDKIIDMSKSKTTYSDKAACSAQYERDVSVCRQQPRAETRASCYKQAAVRLAACNRGFPNPPLNF